MMLLNKPVTMLWTKIIYEPRRKSNSSACKFHSINYYDNKFPCSAVYVLNIVAKKRFLCKLSIILTAIKWIDFLKTVWKFEQNLENLHNHNRKKIFPPPKKACTPQCQLWVNQSYMKKLFAARKYSNLLKQKGIKLSVKTTPKTVWSWMIYKINKERKWSC